MKICLKDLEIKPQNSTLVNGEVKGESLLWFVLAGAEHQNIQMCLVCSERGIFETLLCHKEISLLDI